MPRWFWLLAAAVVFLTTLPALVGALRTPEGATYLGIQWNTDDHAVYAAWMKQAQEGRFFFENRFTTDDQPGQTIHLYFWAVGLLSKLSGISLAMHIARVLFSVLALVALYRLVARLANDGFSQALAMVVAVFGGGIGWLLWKRYGHEGPIDVWQPEAFAFPSLLTNGLFAVSLWLILVVFNKMIDARESWRPVIPGAIALLVLTNIHTYDTLLIALISLGWLVSCVFSRTANLKWIARCALIAAGALPAVAWFLYVRSVDPVFVARANTPTPSPPPISVVYGLLPLIILALIVILTGRSTEARSFRFQPVLLLLVLFVVFVYSCDVMRRDDPFAALPFAICLLIALVACSRFVSDSPAFCLLFAWLAIVVIAPYYPGLFQRKLGMSLAIPYGIAAGLALAAILPRVRIAPVRLLALGAALLILCLTSLRWIQRELEIIRDDVSNTTVHRVFLGTDETAILGILSELKKESDVLLARPGVPLPLGDDEFAVLIPDLNPIMTGWAGIRTYAGHWSETPQYNERREELSATLFNPATATAQSIREMIDKTGATYVILPVHPELAPYVVPIEALAPSTEDVLYRGDEFALLKVR